VAARPVSQLCRELRCRSISISIAVATASLVCNCWGVQHMHREKGWVSPQRDIVHPQEGESEGAPICTQQHTHSSTTVGGAGVLGQGGLWGSGGGTSSCWARCWTDKGKLWLPKACFTETRRSWRGLEAHAFCFSHVSRAQAHVAVVSEDSVSTPLLN